MSKRYFEFGGFDTGGGASPYEVGVTLRFTYKGGRKVKGVVVRSGPQVTVLKLHTDYIGKNVEWFAGEEKAFNNSEMKNVIP